MKTVDELMLQKAKEFDEKQKEAEENEGIFKVQFQYKNILFRLRLKSL